MDIPLQNLIHELDFRGDYLLGWLLFIHPVSDAGGEAGDQVLVLGGEAGGQVSVSAGQVTEAELQPSASYHHATYGGHHHEPDEYHGGHHSQARASNDPSRRWMLYNHCEGPSPG